MRSCARRFLVRARRTAGAALSLGGIERTGPGELGYGSFAKGLGAALSAGSRPSPRRRAAQKMLLRVRSNIVTAARPRLPARRARQRPSRGRMLLDLEHHELRGRNRCRRPICSTGVLRLAAGQRHQVGLGHDVRDNLDRLPRPAGLMPNANAHLLGEGRVRDSGCRDSGRS